jgi:hypothetical protein
MQKDDFPLYNTNKKTKEQGIIYVAYYLPEKETNNYQITSYF